MVIHLGKDIVEKNSVFTTCIIGQTYDIFFDLCLCSTTHTIIGKAQVIDSWTGPLKHVPAMLLEQHHSKLLRCFGELFCSLKRADHTVTLETIVTFLTLIRYA